MSERAIAFVEEWVSENVGAEDAPDESKAAAYAVQCAAEAKEAGIPDTELNDAFESLTAFMSAAIVSATRFGLFPHRFLPRSPNNESVDSLVALGPQCIG